MNGALWGALAALCYGGSDFLARFSSTHAGAANAVLGTLCVSALLLTGAVSVSGGVPIPDGRIAGLVVLAGISSAATLLCLYSALARGPISVAAPVVSAYPALVVLFSLPLGIWPTPLQWLGMVLTLLGIVWLARQTGQREESGADPMRTGRVAGTLALAGAAAVLAAAQILLGQEARQAAGALATIWTMRVVGVLTLLMLAALRRQRPCLPRAAWPFVLAQGVLETIGLLALLHGSLGPARPIAAVASSGFAVVTVLLARLVLREPVGPGQWTAIAVVLAGIGLLSYFSA